MRSASIQGAPDFRGDAFRVRGRLRSGSDLYGHRHRRDRRGAAGRDDYRGARPSGNTFTTVTDERGEFRSRCVSATTRLRSS